MSFLHSPIYTFLFPQRFNDTIAFELLVRFADCVRIGDNNRCQFPDRRKFIPGFMILLNKALSIAV